MKKLLLVMLLLSGYLFGAINVQTASKAELMSISGIGSKKADAIIKYRKTHKLKSADDLLKVKGIGKKIVYNVKNGVKNKSKSKSSTKKSTKKTQKSMSKKESHKKSSKKKEMKSQKQKLDKKSKKSLKKKKKKSSKKKEKK